MVERSLQASPAGIQAAKTALISFSLTHEKLEMRSGISRSTISKFFNGKPVDRNLFVQICEMLKLDWREITGQPQTDTEQEQDSIDALVQAVREQIKPLIKERCGTMKVLDMTQAIALTGEQGIYTNVNILEKITGRRRLGLEDLLQGCDLEEFDRFGLSRVMEKRVPGLEAVERYSKLMVLGKPGAGKTTFLKYLAMQCIEGNFQADCIPIFITLKSFAEDENQPNLSAYLKRLILGNHVSTNHHPFRQFTANALQLSIQQGRLLILLDGLDEVREEDTTRVLGQIREFSEHFHANQFVVTCRIAAKEYTFQKFTEVEVADFDDEQIHTFVGNWFKCREPENAEKLTEKLITKLEEQEPIKELATNPLLLTLLCLEFEELLEFPTNRAELYDRGLAVLLSKWNNSRRIEREQVYKRLSLKRKEDLLSQVALTTFEQKDYFFKQRTVEGYIADYISNLPDAQTDPEALLLNSEAVLKSIESQHGLLIERAKGIYSFSHLTFQEYFSAKEINSRLGYKALMSRITEKRWREVFLLIVDMARSANEFLCLMKQKVDGLIINEEEIQQFLKWINKKSLLLKNSYKPAAIRAFYLLSNSSLCSALKVEIEDDISRLNYLLHNRVSQSKIASLLRSGNNLVTALSSDFQIESGLKFDFVISRFLIHPCIFEIDNALSLAFPSKLQHLRPEFQKLKDAIADHFHDLSSWWEVEGKIQFECLHRSISEHCDLGYNWQLSEGQEELLRQYYSANKLLVDCLNSDCYVSREVRQEIEDTLLLPIAEIEKYNAAKAAQ